MMKPSAKDWFDNFLALDLALSIGWPAESIIGEGGLIEKMEAGDRIIDVLPDRIVIRRPVSLHVGAGQREGGDIDGGDWTWTR
ncbi:MAG: hypothetical protein V1755_00585 [Chloroflexota bacterium]